MEPAGPPPALANETGVQTAPNASEAVVPLPPPTEAPRPTPSPALAAAARRLDLLIVAAVVLLAFFASSFAAANGDLFRHLATGRLLAEGKYHFGDEPFTWGASGEWVNPSWGFDYIVYRLYILDPSGAVLVFLKAVLVAGLVFLLVLCGRAPSVALWLPAVCAGLAALVIATRAQLQPAFVSYCLLGLTLYLVRLVRTAPTQDGPAPSPLSRRFLALWFLPLVFAVWANLDSWFVLGPITVALYLGGEALRSALTPARAPADGPVAGELRALSLVLAVGVAACLVNPFAHRALSAIDLLRPGGEAAAFLQDGIFRTQGQSPLQGGYFEAGSGLSVAGMAYFVLLALSALSFVAAAFGPAGIYGLVGWRLFVWLPFAALSMYTTRGIGLFGVVAAPVLALNLATLLQRQPVGQRPILGLALRGLGLVLVLAGAVAAWPGWLHPLPHNRHRVNWAIVPDPSLRDLALHIQDWHDKGLLPANARWLNLSPDVADYIDWFAPGQRVCLDHRLALFGPMAHDYLALRRALAPEPGASVDAPDQRAKVWETVLRKHHARLLIVNHAERGRSLIMFNTMAAGPGEWKPCYLEGRSAVFAWKDPQGPDGADPLAGIMADFRKLAFGPHAERAPEAGPDVVPEPQPWYAELWEARPVASEELEAASLHVVRFQAMSGYYDPQRAWLVGFSASLVGAAAVSGQATLGNLLPLRLASCYGPANEGEGDQPDRLAPAAFEMFGRAVRTMDAGPPESLYLALRAARRAIEASPDDPRSHFYLGQVYSQLWNRTREQYLARGSPVLAGIRRTQIATAFNRALRLAPPVGLAVEAHAALAEHFATLGYLDREVRHREALVAAAESGGPNPGEQAKNFEDRLKRLRDMASQRRKLWERQDNDYEVRAVNKPIMQKAELARERGLADKAISVLASAERLEDLQSPGRGGVPGRNLLLELLLNTGQAEEAAELLRPEGRVPNEAALASELWFHVRHAAAVGDYALADALLASALRLGEAGPGRDVPGLLSMRAAISQGLGYFVLREATQAAQMPWQIHRHLPCSLQPPYGWRSPESAATIVGLSATSGLQLCQGEAEMHLVRGWLALEAGETSRADAELAIAESLILPPERWAPVLSRLPMTGPQAQSMGSVAAGQASALALCRRYREWLAAAR